MSPSPNQLHAGGSNDGAQRNDVGLEGAAPRLPNGLFLISSGPFCQKTAWTETGLLSDVGAGRLIQSRNHVSIDAGIIYPLSMCFVLSPDMQGRMSETVAL